MATINFKYIYTILILLVIANNTSANVYKPEVGEIGQISWKIVWIEPPASKISVGAEILASWQLETSPIQKISHTHVHLCKAKSKSCKSEKKQHLKVLSGSSGKGYLFDYNRGKNNAYLDPRFDFKSGDRIKAVVHAKIEDSAGKKSSIYGQPAYFIVD